jgi:hypothetical protein
MSEYVNLSQPLAIVLTIAAVFTKLASQLTAEKLVELGVIPFIFIVQVIVSYFSALLISRICKFNKRAKNFVIAMAVRLDFPFETYRPLTCAGFWQLQLSAYLSRHIPLEDALGATLG